MNKEKITISIIAMSIIFLVGLGIIENTPEIKTMLLQTPGTSAKILMSALNDATGLLTSAAGEPGASGISAPALTGTFAVNGQTITVKRVTNKQVGVPAGSVLSKTVISLTKNNIKNSIITDKTFDDVASAEQYLLTLPEFQGATDPATQNLIINTQQNQPTTDTTSQQTVQQSNILNIASVSAVSDINVSNGTTLDLANLPDTITVTLSDNTSKSVAVAWDNGTPDYNSDTAGTYVFSGAPAFSGDLTNTNNLKATVKVIVAAETSEPATPAPTITPPASTDNSSSTSGSTTLPATTPSDNSSSTATAPDNSATTPAPTDNSTATATGDLIQSTGASFINSVVQFTKFIFQTISFNAVKLVPNVVKTSVTDSASFVKADISSDFQQMYSQFKETGNTLMSPLNKLFGK